MGDHELPSTWPALFAEIVATRGDHDAIVTAAGTLSYAELDRRTARIARALLAMGAGKGARIALMAPDGPYWLTMFLGGLRIGALVTLVSTLCTPPELAHILRNSDAQMLITVRGFLRHDYTKTLTAALPGLAEAKAGALRLPMAPYLRSIWIDDPAGLGWAGSIEDLAALADAPDAPDAALLAAVEAEVAPGDDAVIIYTSGSTAQPKAVMHRQWTVARHPRALAPYFLISADDRMMSLLPAFWLGGLATTLQVLSVGGTLVYADSPDPEAVLDAYRRFGANAIHSWGVRHQKLRDAAIARGLDIERMRGLHGHRDKQGQPIPPHLQAGMFGMSESFSPHSAEPHDMPLPEEKAGSAGRAVNGYERRVVDPETGEVLPFGQVGELQIRGPALMTGFYKVDKAKIFTPDGFYPTSDLARMDEDGHIWFHGRRGDMIKTGTANVSRLEVEATLNALPDVQFSFVAGLPDAELGQLLAAAVVPAEGMAPTEESLKAALRETLSTYKIPRRIILIAADEIRLTPTGKIKLFEMADLIAERIAVDGATVAA